MRRSFLRLFVLPPTLALIALVPLLLLPALQPTPTLPSASAAPLLATTGTHTIYLPLVLNNFSPTVYPNDPYFGSQWGLSMINAPHAWGLSRGSPSVLIAVVDSGIDLDHPDLASKVRADIDYDFVRGDEVADDECGHGTHVAGIAAAATDNGIGTAGLGWEATILPLKVMTLTNSGVCGGTTADVVSAISYATDNGADVINMSLGAGVACSEVPGAQDAINYAYARGVVLVAAAGNHGGDVPNAELFPANCDHVLGVAAVNSDGSIASYSNYGNHVSVAAPGTNIYSTLMGGGYGYMSGTSMATPHVAGLAALLRAHYPSYTPDQIASAILDNAEDIGAAGRDDYAGCGLIDAYRALLNGAQGATPLCPEQTSSTSTASAETSAAAALFVPGELLLSLRPGVEATQVALRYRLPLEPVSRALGIWRMRVPVGEELTILSRLQVDPAVRYAHPNYIVTALP
ncbi:MAG TPA: peptidase S8 [Thermoflexia bacterium]|nr:peptidase S8 [Thermoflexia bacterium]